MITEKELKEQGYRFFDENIMGKFFQKKICTDNQKDYCINIYTAPQLACINKFYTADVQFQNCKVFETIKTFNVECFIEKDTTIKEIEAFFKKMFLKFI